MQNNLELMNCADFAKLFGIKTQTVYTWLCKKQLPKNIYRKLGRKPVFIKSEVEDWFMKGANLNGNK